MVHPTERFGMLKSDSLKSRSWLYHPNTSHHPLGTMHQPNLTESPSLSSPSLQLQSEKLEKRSFVPSIELPTAPRKNTPSRDLVPYIFLLTFSALLLSFVTILLVLGVTQRKPTASQGPSPYARVASAYMEQFKHVMGQKEIRPLLERQLKQQVGEVLTKIGVPKSTTGALAPVIVSEGIGGGLDPLFIAAVVRHESTFNTRAISAKGAVGLMQLLPSTAQYVSQKNNIHWRGDDGLFDAQYNLKLGVRYLRYLERSFGNWEHILVAYNWGPGNLSAALKRGGHVPTSTLRYARSIIQTHAKWRDENNLPSLTHG